MSIPSGRPLVAGNWKMNGLKASLAEAGRLREKLAGQGALPCDVLICPPATLLMAMKDAVAGSAISTGGQDCHTQAAGAHTGDVSAAMLADAGASYVIVGHSERRADHGETSASVAAKARAAHAAGLIAIICIGETEAERDDDRTLGVVEAQLAASVPENAAATNAVIAYEPVWAIGSGRTPTVAEVAEVHGYIRARLTARFGAEGAAMRILYGGSVKPGNARELMAVPHVNGALVGGASLRADDFWGIIGAYL